MSKQIYLTEQIAEGYKTWAKGDIILLGSATGTGKTTLCITLADYALLTQDKILYITSRIAKLEEFKKDTKGHGNFLYTTYQKLEQDIAYANAYLLNQYINCKYIFIDECHYFTDDIAMPDSTASLSEEWLRTTALSPIKIYASATADRYFKLLRSKISIPDNHIYEVDKDYSYVTACLVYKKDQAVDILRRILSKKPKAKILFFVNNTNRMEEFFETFGYEEADYLCSDNTTDTYLKKICNITNKQFTSISFKKRILFATKTIDIGVNIKDKNLDYIFCEMQDPNTIVQCLGRKRAVSSDDTCKFLICNQDAKTLSLYNNKAQKYINDYEAYCCNPDGFIRQHKDDRNLNKGGSVFILTPGCGDIQIDIAKVKKYKFDIRFYNYVKQHSFIEALKLFLDDYLAQLIKPYDYYSGEAIKFLRSHEGERFYKDDKHIITDYFSSIIKESRTFGINVINNWLSENVGDRYTKRLISKKDRQRLCDDGSKNLNYDANYWEIG